MDNEMVNHPSHYNKGDHEVIDVIEDWRLGFHTGNAIKYIARHAHKESPMQDIDKAIWYLQRYKETLEKAKKAKTENGEDRCWDIKMTSW